MKYYIVDSTKDYHNSSYQSLDTWALFACYQYITAAQIPGDGGVVLKQTDIVMHKDAPVSSSSSSVFLPHMRLEVIEYNNRCKLIPKENAKELISLHFPPNNIDNFSTEPDQSSQIEL